MKITVVTVAYNAADTVRQTLQSVAQQNYDDIEHIVVDGASTDDTLKIIEQEKRPFTTVISEPDTGIYDAMNKGIEAATGDVIGFLNADDVYCDHDVLSRIAQAFSDDIDIVYGDVDYVSDGDAKVIRHYSSKYFLPSRVAWGWMPAHPAMYLRCEVVRSHGLFCTDYVIAGDFEYVARLSRSPQLKYRYMPEVLVKMRVGGVSTKGLRNTILLNREVLRACRENNIQTNIFKVMTKYPMKLIGLQSPFVPG